MELIFDELKTGQYIFDLLRENIGNNVYFDRVPEGTAFPYAVFNFASVFQGEDGKSTFMLELNIWDNAGNAITELLTLQKDIQTFLHKRNCISDDLTLFFNLESTLQIDDPEEQIRRRELRFSVKYYNRK